MISNMTRLWRPAKSFWRICALGLLLLLVACGGRPTATPAPAAGLVAPIDSAEFPDANSTILIEPETGGAIRLRGGAGVTLPPQALSQKAAVTLRIENSFPAVPIPRSLLGNVYELALEGGELTGLALVRLPIPPEVNVGEYDLALQLERQHLGADERPGGERRGADEPDARAHLPARPVEPGRCQSHPGARQKVCRGRWLCR